MSKIFKLILILVLLGGILAYVYSIFSPSPTPVSFILAGAQTNALIIDMDADNKLGINTVLNTQDAILTLHMGNANTEHENDIIHSQTMLEQFDRNRDGTIDANDAVYSKLELMFLENTPDGLKIHYVPIAQAGIRAIHVDTKYLSPEIRQQSSHLRRAVGAAIMADGSIRLIRDIVIDESYLTSIGSNQ